MLWGFCGLLAGRPFTALAGTLPRLFRHLYALVLILFGWVLFVFSDLSQAWQYWQARCHSQQLAGSADAVPGYQYALLLLLPELAAVPGGRKLR